MPSYEEGLKKVDDQLRQWQIASEISQAVEKDPELSRAIEQIKKARRIVQNSTKKEDS